MTMTWVMKLKTTKRVIKKIKIKMAKMMIVITAVMTMGRRMR